MKLTTFTLTALCTTLAAATPLDKRVWATTYELFTVTGYPPAETPVRAVPSLDVTPSSDGNGWGDWHGGWDGESAAPSSVAPTAPSSTGTAPTKAATPAESNRCLPSSSSSPPSTTSSIAPASTSVSFDYQQGILDSHNIHRQNASIPALTWSDDMASIAA